MHMMYVIPKTEVSASQIQFLGVFERCCKGGWKKYPELATDAFEGGISLIASHRIDSSIARWRVETLAI